MVQLSKRCLSTGVVVFAVFSPFNNTDASERDLSLVSEPSPNLTRVAVQSRAAVPTVEDLPTTSTPTTVPENFAPLFTPRVGVRSSTAEAGGNPFSVIEGFVPLAQSRGRDLLFMEGRQFYDLAEGTAGRNFLLGYRRYDRKGDRVWGGYLAYDNRDTGNSLFDQVGVGLESIGKHWDLRVNGYLPIGNTRNQVLEVYASGGQFQGNSLLVERARVFESALGGFDAEVGAPLARWTDGQLKGYAGVYYLGGSGSGDTLGLRGRLQAQINDLTAVGLTLEQDDLFDTRAIVNVGITFRQTPKGRSDRNLEISPVIASLGSRVQRSTSIAVNSDISQDVTIARHPDTGQPLTFRHVDLGNGTGAGTVENPFGSLEAALAAARPGDIVRVGSATDTTLGELRIPDQVNLVAASMPTAVRTRQAARVALPRTANNGRITVNGPITLESNGTVAGLIINANNNHGVIGNNVTGVASVVDNIINVTGEFDGINITNTSGSVDLTIARNEINGGRNGIFINTKEGAQATVTVADNRIQDTRGSGIFFRLEGESQVNATIDRNTVLRNQGIVPQDGGLRFGVFDAAIGTAIVRDNTFSDNRSHGMFVGSQANGQLTATFENNTANNNLGNGLFFGAEQNSIANTTITGNTTNNNQLNPALGNFPTGNGLAVGSQNDGQTRATIANNTANNNTSNGIFIFAQPGAVEPDAPPPRPLATANITGNQVSEGPGNGIWIRNAQDATVSGNTIRNVSGTGIRFDEVGGDVVAADNVLTFPPLPDDPVLGFETVNGTPNPIRASCGGTCFTDTPFPADFDPSTGGKSGIRYFRSTDGVSTLSLRNNRISQASATGILVGIANAAALNVQATGNESKDNRGSGVFMFALNDSVLNATIDQNTTTGNQGRIFNESGIRVVTFDNAQMTGTFTNNRASDNRGNGIFFALNDNSRATGEIRNNVTQRNVGNGIFFGTRRTSDATALIQGNRSEDNEINANVIPTAYPNGAGISVGTQETGRITAVVADNRVSGNGRINGGDERNNPLSGSGISFFAIANSQMSVTAINNTVTTSRESSGISFAVNDGAQGEGLITDNVVLNNEASGIDVNIGPFSGSPSETPAQATVTIANNRVQGNLGVGPTEAQGGTGIMLRSFNQATLRAIVENNTVTNYNGVGAPGQPFTFAGGIGLLALDDSVIEARVRFNEMAENSAKPGFAARSLGNSRFCLRLENNRSDTTSTLGQLDTSLFQADTPGNVGPAVVRVGRVLGLGNCPTP